MKWIVELEGGEAFPANAAAACRIAATGKPVGYLGEVFRRLETALGGAKPPAKRRQRGGEVAPRLISWDWRAQPPMDRIAAAVSETSRHGQVFMREVDTGRDSYVWAISGRELSEDELARLAAE